MRGAPLLLRRRLQPTEAPRPAADVRSDSEATLPLISRWGGSRTTKRFCKEGRYDHTPHCSLPSHPRVVAFAPCITRLLMLPREEMCRTRHSSLRRHVASTEARRAHPPGVSRASGTRHPQGIALNDICNAVASVSSTAALRFCQAGALRVAMQAHEVRTRCEGGGSFGAADGCRGRSLDAPSPGCASSK
jgi:hypothetical protein